MNIKMLKAAVAGLVLAVSGFANAGLIVAPNENASIEGDSNNCYPFSCSIYRYQQVFNSSFFGSQSGIIEEIAFRLDGNSQSFSNQSFDLEIRLSNTNTSAGTLSTTFANNIGSDETLVLDSIISLSSNVVTGVNPFDIIIDIADIFEYDGTSNLLLDIVRISGSSEPFDSVRNDVSASEMNRVWSSTNSLTGESLGDRGLVTQFRIATTAQEPSTVPEPSTLAIFALGIMGLTSRRFKKQ